MADADKNILITPNRGSTTADPNIVFTGGDNNPVTMTVLDDGTLSFSGSAGQLFSISDDLSGTIFSVNDVSGIPSIEVDDTGIIRLAEFSGNVLVGTAIDNGTDKLQVAGNIGVTGTVQVAGNIAVTGTVDGVDIAALNTAATQSGDSVALTGDVTGSTTVASNGSISITTAVGNDSHTHDGRYYTEAESNESIARALGWVPGYSDATETNVVWNATQDAVELKNAADNSGGAIFKAIRMKSGDQVDINIQAKGSAAATSGVYFRIYFWNGSSLPNGKTHVSGSATYSFVQESSSGDSGWYENSTIGTSWTNFSRSYTAPADGFMSVVVLNWTGFTGSIYLKQPDIQFKKVNVSSSCSGAAASAASWTTSRTLTIGSTGKSVNGTEDVSWTLAEIGAQAAGDYAVLNNTTVQGDDYLFVNRSSTNAVLYINQRSTGDIARFINNSTSGNTGTAGGAAGQFTVQNSGAFDAGAASNIRGGLTVSGDINGVTDLYVDDQIISTGDTNTYMQFHAADQWRVVTGGSERLEVNNTNVTINNATLIENSDIRQKSEIEPITNALDKVKKIGGYTYVKDNMGGVRSTGVIAQEVLEVLPEAVTENDEGFYAVAYSNMVGLLIEAIKEQQQQIDELKNIIEKS